MNDDPALAATWRRLTEARDVLGDEHMTIPAGEIFARGTKRHARRWLAATGAACVAIGVAAAVTLAPGSSARPRPEQGHAQLAAWSVHANPDGTVSFMLQNTSHPAELQRALARAGVRAVVRWGEICLAVWPPQPLLGGEGAFMTTNLPGGASSYFALQGGGSGQGAKLLLDWSWTIIPSKMPSDGQFVISAIPGPVSDEYIQAAWEFAKTSAPITCAKFLKPGQKP